MLERKRIVDNTSMEKTLYSLTEAIDQLDQASSNENRENLCTLFKDLATGLVASLNSMEEKFDLFEAIGPKLDQMLSQSLPSKEAATEETGVSAEPNLPTSSIPKLILPKFDGETDDARVWISKCNTFFEFHPMPERQMVGYASFHMIGHAFKWFMGYQGEKGDYLKWNDFSEAFIKRFADTKYIDSSGVMKEFTELAQTGTVLEYLEKYEDIVVAINDKFPDIPRSYLVTIFIDGLKEDIRMKVKMLQPDTVVEAFRLARTCEASLKVSATPGPSSSGVGTAPTVEAEQKEEEEEKVVEHEESIML